MANNFSLDPNCKAVWRFESGALNVDSLGNVPNLNPYGSPAADGTHFKEGSYSLSLPGSPVSFYGLADSYLPSGFPLKSTDTGGVFSISFWYLASSSNTGAAVSKDYLNIGRCFIMYPGGSGSAIIKWGYGSLPNPSGQETLDTGWTPTNGQWYHYGIAIDRINKTALVRIWGDTEAAIVYSHTFTPTNEMDVNANCNFAIGAASGTGTSPLTGNLDELTVFASLLDADGFDKIRLGTYPISVFEYAGNIPFTVTPAGTYSYQKGPYVYTGNIPFTVTPGGTYDWISTQFSFWDDFELGNLSLWTSNQSVSLVAPTVPSMTGLYCAHFDLDASYLRKTVSVLDAYFGFDFYPDQEENNCGVICSVQGDSGTLGLLHFYYIGGQGYLRAYLGNYASQVGATGEFPFSTKCRIQVRFYPDSTNGRFVVKVNGVAVIDFTGYTADAATIIRSFQFGTQNNDSGQFYLDNVGLSSVTYPSNIFTYTGNVPLSVTPGGEYAKIHILPYAAAGGCLSFGGNASVYDVVTPAVNAFTATGSIALDGRCTLQSSIPAQATSEFQPIGSISLGGGCQFDDGIVPAFLENVFVAAGSLAFPGYARLVSTLPSSVGYSAKGSLKLGGWGSTLDVVYPSSLSSEFQAAGVLEIGGAGTLDAPQIIVTELVAFCGTGAPVLLLGSNSVVGFIISTSSAYRAAGSLAFIGPDTSEEDVFETWALSGFTFEPSFFANYPFNSFAIRQGKAYGAGENGIFLLEGADDDGQEIVPGVRIGPHNFSTDKHKRLRLLRLGDAGVNAQVRVVADEGTPEYVTADGIGRFPVSRAVEGRELTVDVEGFEQLSQVEIVTVVTSRR